MISIRGIAMSLAIHGVAAVLISASAAIQPDQPVEDVAAIPVELILETEAAPVTPSAPVEEFAETPVQEVVEAPVVEVPVQGVVETPVVETHLQEVAKAPLIEPPVQEVVEEPVAEPPVQEVVKAPVVETPEQKVVEIPVPEPVSPPPVAEPESFKTASVQPPEILPEPEPAPQPEPELVTQREMPVQMPAVLEEKPKFAEPTVIENKPQPVEQPIVEAKPKPAEPPVAKKMEPVKAVQKIQKAEKPKEAKLKKTAKKTLNVSKKKQVAALAAGKGSVGKQRSTDGRAAESNYDSKVLARLRAVKKYAAAKLGTGIEGTAVLSFTISSSGRLTSARVVRGGGHALLDSAVLSMARNAAPFPPFPSSISKSQKTFIVPIQFIN
jgi:protein TonB